jgi:hypothetical protein
MSKRSPRALIQPTRHTGPAAANPRPPNPRTPQHHANEHPNRQVASFKLRQLVAAHGSTLTDLYGIGPSAAARLIGDIVGRAGPAQRVRTWLAESTA